MNVEGWPAPGSPDLPLPSVGCRLPAARDLRATAEAGASACRARKKPGWIRYPPAPLILLRQANRFPFPLTEEGQVGW